MIWEAKVIKNTVIIFFRGGGIPPTKNLKSQFSQQCVKTQLFIKVYIQHSFIVGPRRSKQQKNEKEDDKAAIQPVAVRGLRPVQSPLAWYVLGDSKTYFTLPLALKLSQNSPFNRITHFEKPVAAFCNLAMFLVETLMPNWAFHSKLDILSVSS